MNKNSNPAAVFAARNARLVRESKTPVYTTETPAAPAREHMKLVEMEADTGYRSWSAPMHENRVSDYIESFPFYYMLSDVDCAFTCWCVKEGVYGK